MSGSTTGSSFGVETPAVFQVWRPERKRVVWTVVRVPASGYGFGAGGSQEPGAALGGGGDAVAFVVVLAEAFPGLGGDLDGQAEGAGALVQPPDRQPAGDGGELVDGQEDLALTVDGVGGEQVGQGSRLRFGDGGGSALQGAVPGVGVGEGGPAVQAGSEAPP